MSSSRTLTRQAARAKPPQKTIVSRSTARGMRYLQAKGLADFSKTNIMIPKSSLKRNVNGYLSKSEVPSHGV